MKKSEIVKSAIEAVFSSEQSADTKFAVCEYLYQQYSVELLVERSGGGDNPDALH